MSTKDNPKPAILIARKLLGDFVILTNKKIEAILTNQETNQKQVRHDIFGSLLKGEDQIYDQILEGLGAISEFCLPSMLRILVTWYNQQIGTDDQTNHQQHQQTTTTSASMNVNNDPSALFTATNPDCGSPSGNDSLLAHLSSNSATAAISSDYNHHPSLTTASSTVSALSNATITNVRSSTPSSPDISVVSHHHHHHHSQPISITSTLPLDYQSTSMTIFSSSAEAHQQSSSAANTSNSTATNASSSVSMLEDSASTMRRLEFLRVRKSLIEYTFCRVLIEIFSQLHLHPGHEDLIRRIEDIAFEHFKYDANSSDLADTQVLANKFAEVMGVLARTRFNSVRKRFNAELAELKAKEMTPHNIQCIVTLLSGMKYFRVKMAPIEDFEASFQFLQECADYFLETRHKSIKHALAELFVEIMVPMASTVKNEVKIPCLKNFVETLWSPTLDMCSRKKHSVTLFPLVTCLLCVSQRSIFLSSWGTFLNLCLSNLKNRDHRMCRVALESLYRLIWIYMIRVKCESNNITQARLNSVVDAIFPRGSRQVNPRDAPLSIFVDLIHFIAQERLDFAMRHIIFELLSVDRPIKVILAPERMNIALQAFLVIADSLLQKDGDPPMPISIGYSINASTTSKTASSSSSKSSSDKKSSNSSSQQQQSLQQTVDKLTDSKQSRSQYLNLSNNFTTLNNTNSHSSINKMITDDIAKSIGIYPYCSHIQRSFNDILKALDTQYGRPLLLNTSQNLNRDDVITSERKPKVDLFKTCIAAIPRLMPDGMSKADLIDLLARMTIHVDEEMRRNALLSLQILVTDFTDWRLDAIEGYTLFVANQIDESMRHLIDNALKILLQLLISWRNAITLNGGGGIGAGNASGQTGGLGRANSTVSIQTGYETISSRASGSTGGQIAARKNRALAEMRLIQSELSNTRFDRLVQVIQKVEAASLVMLCSCYQPTRKIAAHILHESRSLLKSYSTWTCMEHFGFRSPDEVDEEDLSASMKGSLSADNLSRITATSVNGPLHSSVTSMNTQAMLTTSISKMCISSSSGGVGGNQQQMNQHDLYDEDIENNLAECFTGDDNSLLMFWFSVIMLESEIEQEYALGLRLLKRVLPTLPFEQHEFLVELEKTLEKMKWTSFPGLHSLVLKGCASSSTYDSSIVLLDQLTPILKHPTCTLGKPEQSLPAHVITLMTHLLYEYDDPTPYSLNMARRIALCCDENSTKLENLSAVMALYSRRSFSKDGFQWIKCVVKYLHDAYPTVLPQVIPLLIDMLEQGPEHVQRHIAPILYCLLTYVDINSQALSISLDLMRLYNKYLNSGDQWKDAVQLFKLIISRSSRLAESTTTSRLSSGGALPGRVMDFDVEFESIELIGKTRLGELGGLDISTPLGAAVHQAALVAAAAAAANCSANTSSASSNNNNNNNTATTTNMDLQSAHNGDSGDTQQQLGDQSTSMSSHQQQQADKSNSSNMMLDDGDDNGPTMMLLQAQSSASLKPSGQVGANDAAASDQVTGKTLPPRSLLSQAHIRERIVSLLMSGQSQS